MRNLISAIVVAVVILSSSSVQAKTVYDWMHWVPEVEIQATTSTSDVSGTCSDRACVLRVAKMIRPNSQIWITIVALKKPISVLYYVDVAEEAKRKRIERDKKFFQLNVRLAVVKFGMRQLVKDLKKGKISKIEAKLRIDLYATEMLSLLKEGKKLGVFKGQKWLKPGAVKRIALGLKKMIASK